MEDVDPGLTKWGGPRGRRVWPTSHVSFPEVLAVQGRLLRITEILDTGWPIAPDPHGAQKMVLLSHSAPRSMATRPAGGFPLLGSLVSGGHLGVWHLVWSIKLSRSSESTRTLVCIWASWRCYPHTFPPWSTGCVVQWLLLSNFWWWEIRFIWRSRKGQKMLDKY